MKPQRGEPAVSGLRRVFTEELASARARLLDPDANHDAAIHEARRSLKKARSILKLIAGDLDRSENARLRNIGRLLSPFRDAVAFIETFDKVRAKNRDKASPEAYRAARAGLVALKKELEDSNKLPAAIRKASRDLTPGPPWPVAREHPSAINQGLAATRRKAKRALAQAQKDPRPENFHTLRKRIKTHRFQLMVLADPGPADALETG